MTYSLRYTKTFYRDLERLYDFLVLKDTALAERAFQAVHKAMELLEDFPFSGRKVSEDDALLRELVVPFGSAGYVILFKIVDDRTVTILAVRHQREDDYH